MHVAVPAPLLLSHQEEPRIAVSKVFERRHNRQQRQVLQRIAAEDQLVPARQRRLPVPSVQG